jgi:hypothetical protein
MWSVFFTEVFEEWWSSLSDDEQESLTVRVKLLRALGPALGRPYADTVKQSRHKNMKELRSQVHGRPIRAFYAFDPHRRAILLTGGCKSGDKRFYERMIRQADDLMDKHLQDTQQRRKAS